MDINDFNFSVCECTGDRYAEFLDMIDDAFDYGRGWFIKNMGHVLPEPGAAESADIAKHLIAVNDGVIVGAVGFYPMELVVEGVTLKLGGVGQVSCRKDYRGRGTMSALMNAGIKKMREDGLELSWLSGERARYSNFGYDFCGAEVNYSFYLKNLLRMGLGDGRIYTASAEDDRDITSLDRMYRRTPSHIVRDRRAWHRHLSRRNLEWLICEHGDMQGYVCLSSTDEGGIIEAAGDGDCVLRLLAHCMSVHDKRFVSIQYPYYRDALSERLYTAANYVTLRPIGHMLILDSGSVYGKLLPFAIEQCRERSDADAMLGALEARSLCGISGEAFESAIVSKLLGFIYKPLPKELAGFDFLRPLAVFMPGSDHV